jgi:hypothetical protein
VWRIALNILGFQVAWWSCVLTARADAAWIGVCVAVVVFALHLAISPQRMREAWFIPLATVLGYAADTLATRLGALEFAADSALWPPLWIAALWLSFATTLNTTFAWLQRRLAVAAALGAVSGPLAYAAGAGLGVVALPDPLRSIVVLGGLWGMTVPLLVLIAGRVVQPRYASDVPARVAGAGETA